MSATAPRPITVADACVLIDFFGAAKELLELGARRVWHIHALTPIIAQVRSLDEKRCEELGLVVVEPEIDQVFAAQPRRRSLSFEDRLCLVYARTLTPRGIVWTNDRKMHQEAVADGLQAFWGLDLLVELVRHGHTGEEEALAAASAILAKSRFQVEPIMAQFRAALAALETKGTTRL